MKVAIAGFGIEGRSNYDYYTARGDTVTIIDERDKLTDVPEGAATILGQGVFSQLTDYDIVVRTAGLAPHKITTNGKIWSATNEFFSACRTDIIGVTGTKGKGTTASLIDSIFRAAGLKTVLIGNIGRPALDALEEANLADVVIYELSSFQLWDLEKSPQVAVVLMVEPDHMDVHTSMNEYIAAKANIRRYQGQDGVCFYHPTNKYSRQIAETDAWAEDNSEHKEFLDNAHRFNDASDTAAVYEKDGEFFVRNHAICSTSAVQLPGEHNIDNACAAISAARLYTVDDNAIEDGLRSFTGLPHRLKFIADIKNVHYYDDSIATTPGSAIAALLAFKEPKIIILGGSDKGLDYTELVEVCANTTSQVIAIGQTGRVIAHQCREYHVPVVELGIVPMRLIVEQVQAIAQPGSVVILSPASASFDMFENYRERGDQFIAAVAESASLLQ
jgi:UDP-N-acetylmuramoylalanine--D-glutamate ligase